MTLTRTLRKHYGAYNKWHNIGGTMHKELVRLPEVYLKREDDGTYTKHQTRPTGKYLCFYSEDARTTFLKMNA